MNMDINTLYLPYTATKPSVVILNSMSYVYGVNGMSNGTIRMYITLDNKIVYDSGNQKKGFQQAATYTPNAKINIPVGSTLNCYAIFTGEYCYRIDPENGNQNTSVTNKKLSANSYNGSLMTAD